MTEDEIFAQYWKDQHGDLPIDVASQELIECERNSIGFAVYLKEFRLKKTDG